MTSDDPGPDRAGAARQDAPADEISLFDIWNVLVRRRWVVVAVFAAVAAISVVFALTRPTTYRVSQTIQVGQVEAGAILDESPVPGYSRAAAESGSRTLNVYLQSPQQTDPTAFFDDPATVASEIENLHVPAVRAEIAERDRQGPPLSAAITAQVVDESRLVRMAVEAPAEQVPVYEKLLTGAADRLIASHGEAEERARNRFRDVVVQARNDVADIRDQLEARRGALARLDVKADLTAARIADLETLQEQTDAARLRVMEGQPDLSQATTAMLVANDLRRARQELGELQERLEVDIPAQRADLENAAGALERRIAVAESRVEDLKNRMQDISGTRIVSPPQRTGGPVGTAWPVIVALGCVLGGIAGVLAAFFAEFVSAARAQRPQAT